MAQKSPTTEPIIVNNGGSTPTAATPSDHLAERMKNDKCFYCNTVGHWSRYCPYKTPTSETLKLCSSVTKTYDSPVVHCSCGVPCVTRDFEDGQKFCCPRQYPFDNCGFKRRVDTVKSPQCPCGAGVASLHKWKKLDHNMDRFYFQCRIKKGHGACSFFQWEDNLAKTAAKDQVGQTNHDDFPLSAMTDIQMTDSMNGCMGRRGEFSPPHPKRLNFDSLDREEPQGSHLLTIPRIPDGNKLNISRGVTAGTAGVLPNFNATGNPQGKYMPGVSESSALRRCPIAGSSLQRLHQASSSYLMEPLPSKTQTKESSGLIFLSNTEKENLHAVAYLKKRLSTGLLSLDPFDHEAAKQLAKKYLDILFILGEDIEPLQKDANDIIESRSRTISMSQNRFEDQSVF